MKSLLLLALMLPVFVVCQTSHYDSLYQKGAISKEDYQLLIKSKASDTKAAHYDSLYQSHQISKEDYSILKKTTVPAKPIVLPTYNGEWHRANATTLPGCVFMAIGTAFVGAAIGVHAYNGGVTAASAIFGATGGLSLCVGIGILGHGGVLRHRIRRQEQSDRDQLTIQKLNP